MKDVILARVVKDPDTGCWLWQGATARGYGYVWDQRAQRLESTHRLAYELWVGEIPEGLTLDHEVCDTPLCCNPEHLVPKTSWDNTKRSKTNPFAVKARAEECIHGHALTDDNVYRHPKRGTRNCRECKRIADRRAYRKRVAA